MVNKKIGRPLKPKRLLRKTCTIRITEDEKKLLLKKYDSVQKAVNFLISITEK